MMLPLVIAAMSCLQPSPEASFDRISKAVDSLLAKDQPKLFAWHLRSIKSLAKAELARVEVKDETPGRYKAEALSKEYVEYADAIAKGLEQTCRNPDDYLKNGTRTLVLSRYSNIDGSLQWMMVQLPENWDAGKAYPLNISLHGTGPDHPMAYPSFAFPAEPGGKPHKGSINLTPWGRGNRQWRNDGETDMWEALSTLQTFAKLDEDRWYLAGHSAGADGAWAIALRTPDLWASVGLQSGSMIPARPESGLLENVKNLPFHILIGENDNLPMRLPDSKLLAELLTKMGTPNKLNIMKGIGHYPLSDEGYADQDEWMHRFVRKRPDTFSFTADDPRHPGIWGVRYSFGRWADQIAQPYPKIEVTIKESLVTITSDPKRTLTVDLGPKGLKMSGSVKLIVNGKAIHDGPLPSSPIQIRAEG